MRISYCLLRNLLLGLACASFCVAEEERKVVALTFDDGPNPPYTDKLLQVLETNKVVATFFCLADDHQCLERAGIWFCWCE
ncbi:Peptidoglycan-N-acetylglucosamine deacetylase [Pontiella desulfatans]|uniref:Peptidoglycan-N-acetylglucosamine deacetylase n=1 Tax=Pontiella desulfatans TaxID=2750659 RepID=A0A6C2UF44_PONDE|nr:polysaccharide deacetylase family protein [Pontiella desulfatans]VGO17826.1 Peptidoglycan-N-acetylglucosamine deacetylase [Pontiella desulfatans]